MWQNIMTQKQLGEKRIIWLTLQHCSLFITEGSQDRNSSRAGSWKQELMKRSWMDAAYWLLSHDLLKPPSYRTQDQQPRDGTIHHGLGPPPLITKWENALKLDLIEVFPQLRLLPLTTLACIKLIHKTSQYKNQLSFNQKLGWNSLTRLSRRGWRWK